MIEKVLRYRGEADGEPLHYTACGLEDIYLLSGYQRVTTEHGEGITIKSIDALHRTIGVHLAKERKALSGAEIRFLRKQMDLTQAELAEIIGVDAQSVARWEKGRSDPSGPADMLIRVLYIQYLGEQLNIRELHEELTSSDDTTNRQCFTHNKNGWRQAVVHQAA